MLLLVAKSQAWCRRSENAEGLGESTGASVTHRLDYSPMTLIHTTKLDWASFRWLLERISKDGKNRNKGSTEKQMRGI